MSKAVKEAKNSNEQTGTLVKGAGIISIVLAFINPPLGLITSIVTLIWAKKSGASTKLATIGMIVSILTLVMMLIFAIWVFSLIGAAANDGVINMEAVCKHRESWGWLIDSLRYACR